MRLMMPKTKRTLHGIGVDVVALSRVKDFFEKHRKNLDKILTRKEQRKLKAAPDSNRMLAYLFSAKEAVFKSLDLDWLGIEGFRMIEIEPPLNNEHLGRATLSGKMKKKVARRLREWVLYFLEVDDCVIAKAFSF